MTTSTNKLDKEKILKWLELSNDYCLSCGNTEKGIVYAYLITKINKGEFDYKPKGAISKNDR